MIGYLKIGLFAAGVAAVLYAGYWIRDLSVEGEIIAARNEVILKCEDQYKKAMEESHAFQKELADSNRNLARLKRLYATTRITPTIPSIGTNGGTAGDSGGAQNGTKLHGIPASTLLDTASRCDQYRLRAQFCKRHLENVEQ